MLTIPKLKALLQNLPFSAGAALSQIPYSWRPGHGGLYRRRTREVRLFETLTEEEQRLYIFERMKAIVDYAAANIEFYRHHYRQHSFDPASLRCFDDLRRIPVITKSILQQWDLEKRSCPAKGRHLVNTGGSSGSTLAFYVLPSAIGHEWAHMHHAWAQLGYRQSDLKLGLAGWWDLGSRAFCYDGLRHQFAVNIFTDPSYLAKCLKPVLRRRRVRYLHGYPSAIHDFACYCSHRDEELRDILRGMLCGVFLGSEYPNPCHREMIESTFGVPTLSFYGHTERAVFAPERGVPYVYRPFQTYGFAEALFDSGSGTCRLLGSSYYNTASPLIRYDTSDEISVEAEAGHILRAFRIAAGRDGDYIIDRQGRRISLTGLVFGRHHAIFNYGCFVQVAQSEPGKAVFYVAPGNGSPLPAVIESAFDTAGIDMSFTYLPLDRPIATSRGKVLLRVEVQPDSRRIQSGGCRDAGPGSYAYSSSRAAR